MAKSFSVARIEKSPLAKRVNAAMERGSSAITVYNKLGKGEKITPTLLKQAGIRPITGRQTLSSPRRP